MLTFIQQIMGCDTGHPRDFRHDSGGGGDAGYDPSGGHPAHFDPMPDTFHAEFITQVLVPCDFLKLILISMKMIYTFMHMLKKVFDHHFLRVSPSMPRLQCIYRVEQK